MPRISKNGLSLRIVIIGANFAGLTTAMNLSRKYRVNVIDSRPQFEFLPNTHADIIFNIEETGTF